MARLSSSTLSWSSHQLPVNRLPCSLAGHNSFLECIPCSLPDHFLTSWLLLLLCSRSACLQPEEKAVQWLSRMAAEMRQGALAQLQASQVNESET